MKGDKCDSGDACAGILSFFSMIPRIGVLAIAGISAFTVVGKGLKRSHPQGGVNPWALYRPSMEKQEWIF
jgi:hypothetical protein